MKIQILCFLLLSLVPEEGACFVSPSLSSQLQRRPLEVTREVVQETVEMKEQHDDTFIKRNLEKFHQLNLPKTNKSLSPHVFPLSQVVNQDSIKQALLLAVANPRLGRAGVLIGGGHGTCKSVLARSAIHLLPPELERIAGSPFNAEPLPQQLSAEQQPLELDPLLWDQLHNPGNPEIHDIDSFLGVEHIPMPFVTVPLHVMEESLLGSVDIEKSMDTGTTVFSPGLLAKAHRGILYIDDLHLLEDGIANSLLTALSDGQVTVEREGMSVQYPCRPALVIATYNPEEGNLRDHLMDRFAMTVLSDNRPLTVDQRVQVVENVEGYQDDGSSRNINDDQGLRQNVLEARDLLDQVEITRDQILYLCQESARAGCEGQRAELMATEIAKTVAALQGRTRVTADDLQHAVWMAIAPRAQVPMGAVAEEEETPQTRPSELQPIEPDPDHIIPDEPHEPEDPVHEENEAGEEPDNPMDEPEDEQDSGENEDDLDIPTEFMFGADFDVPIDPQVLHLSQQLARKGKGGKHSKIFSTNRGRFVKAIFPKTINNGRLAIGATLRAAAPHQKGRRQREHHNNDLRHPKVHVTKDDFRIQRLARKAGSLIVFVVDASGSMALNRMGAAKGAAILLLKEAYQSRDKIALVEFHGPRAEVLVPPTKSMSLTRSRLESLPCGGGSPLAHALETSVRLALNELKVKKDVGHVVLVVLTDGRANVPLSASHDSTTANNNSQFISSDRKALKDEVLALTKEISAIPNLDLLCIDTEDQFVGTGIARDLARAGLGNYQHLVGTADTTAIHQLVRQAARVS